MPIYFRRLAALAVSAALILLSPGPRAYAAAFRAAPRTAPASRAAAPVTLRLPAQGLSIRPAAGLAPALSPATATRGPAPSAGRAAEALSSRSAVRPLDPAAAVAAPKAAAPASAASVSLPAGRSSASRAAAGRTTASAELKGESAPAGVLGGLSAAAPRLSAAQGLSGRFAALASMFLGSRGRASAARSPSAGRSPAGLSGPNSVAAGASRARLGPGLAASGAESAGRAPSGSAAESGRPPAPPAKTGAPDDDEFSPDVRRGLIGLFGNRLFSMVAFSISAVAYPLMLIELVGQAESYNLYSIGSALAIGLALIAGKVADRLPLKKYLIANTALRSVLSLTNAVFYAMGWLSFWPLLVLTVINGWQFATLFVTEPAAMAELVGSNKAKLRSTEGLIRMATILVTIFAGLYLSDAIISGLGFVDTFLLVAAISMIPVFIMAKTLPSWIGGERRMPSLREMIDGLRGLLARARDALRGGTGAPDAAARSAALKYVINAAVLAAGAAAFFVWQSPLTIVAAVAMVLLTSQAFRGVILKHPMLRLAAAFTVITVIAELPLRNMVLGALASEMVGPGAKAAFFGNLLAAFYMGQLVTGPGMLSSSLDVTVKKIGPWTLPWPVSFNLKRAMKWVGAAIVAWWVPYYLLPAAWLGAPLAAVGLGAALPAWALTALGAALLAPPIMWLYTKTFAISSKLTNRQWMRLEIGALLSMSLPLFFWGQPWALFAALFLFGMIHNPVNRTVSAIYSSETKTHAGDQFQYMAGVKSSIVNMSSAVAYAIYSLAKTLPEQWGDPNAFPFTWYVVAAMYAGFALLFFWGGRKFVFDDDPKPAPPAGENPKPGVRAGNNG